MIDDLDLIDDPFRRCHECGQHVHEDDGESCGACDEWICRGCWPYHDAHRLSVYRSRAEHDHEHTRRASGACLCMCGLDYLRHPRASEPWNLSFTGEPFLHRLCSGELVKL